MYYERSVLEDFFYIIKEQTARANHIPAPKKIRFTGRKVSEFKSQIYNATFRNQNRPEFTLQALDLEIIHNGLILDNEDELEYCLTTYYNPLIIYVPSDFNQEQYRMFTKIAIDNLENYKHFGSSLHDQVNLLQQNIDSIMEQYCRIESQSVQTPISRNVPQPMIGGDGLFNSTQTLQNLYSQPTQYTTQPASQQSTRHNTPKGSKRGFSLHSELDDMMSDFRTPIIHSQVQSQVIVNQLPPISMSQQVIDLTDSNIGDEPAHNVMSQQLPQIIPTSPSLQWSEQYEKQSQRAKALKKIDVKPLIERINSLINMFGGPLIAFDMEWKIRLFVIEVLNYALIYKPCPINKKIEVHTSIGGDSVSKTNKKDKKQQELRIDGEKGIEQFGQKVQPDLTVQYYDSQQMLYIIEIKNFNTIKGKGILKTAISENFKQLRNYCLQRKKLEMMGISTNFGMWIFTFYSKKTEVITSTQPFMVSDPIEIMDIRDAEMREDELRKLILIINLLCQNNQCLL
ncbi:UNKNOWN [Stylonychia lemnae]|uniref:Uncharacterized protein n=1 Tax=Stylonychia lemnae TaxID=5949 RepID=A0A078B650_STYLE|nr:UNKNOWN [Stylonychia lemnae]|eukprot:CDW88787.1 UNKNOWN [Stylonychia lemnae]